jgi:hypothetical protein
MDGVRFAFAVLQHLNEQLHLQRQIVQRGRLERLHEGTGIANTHDVVLPRRFASRGGELHDPRLLRWHERILREEFRARVVIADEP